MDFRISTLLCWALLAVLASAAQNNQKNNGGFTFKDADAEIEGSGFEGEVNRDLESSGSGAGPDDEDNEDYSPPDSHPGPPVVEEVPRKIVPEVTQVDTTRRIDKETFAISPTEGGSDVIMNPKSEDRATSFFAQPGILAAVIGGAVVGLLFAILVVMFIVYRMRKKDEGSYALGEPKQSPNSNSYSRGTTKEFYA
ncbi:syndecan [Cylas formicarius]|uniref:syndecan n=1 Tax=Cylas formicarius TaxID=197179 RepID=UPI00295862EF|nr:syndecan [Cylas formicarius]